MQIPQEKENAVNHYRMQCRVKVLNKTDNPIQVLNNTLDKSITGKVSIERIKNAINMGHTSFLEFIDITFEVSPITKSFLGQITRHRMASYMSSSYHYTLAKRNHFIMPYVPANKKAEIEWVFTRLQSIYENLIELNVLREEARNILPGAIAHTLIFKMNGRSLFNFFNLRLCNRNIPEMIAVAQLMYEECMLWSEDIFKLAGPDCKFGHCRQGKMSCSPRYNGK